jgi:hypothetical protein
MALRIHVSVIMTSLMLTMLVVLGWVVDGSATVILVPRDKPTIKSAIVAALNGDTILVLPGTYRGTGNRDLDLGGKALVLRSLKGPYSTLIDCQGSRNDPHRAFYIHQGETETTVIQGFMIRNGYAPWTPPSYRSIGGAILCVNNSSPTIVDCILEANRAENGGGGLCCLDNSSPVLIECAIFNNVAMADVILPAVARGGGIWFESSSPRLNECVIAGNRADLGGGVYCAGSDIAIDACVFQKNQADPGPAAGAAVLGSGGGLYCENSSPVITGTVFDGNLAASSAAGAGRGGGVACLRSIALIQGGTFCANVAEESDDPAPGLGADLYLLGSPTVLENSIIAFGGGGAAVHCADDTLFGATLVPSLSCCDIYGNDAGDWTDSIADQAGQNGNFSADPMFCSYPAGNVDLSLASPCLPESTTCGVLIGARPQGCITDVDDPSAAGPLPTELRQNRPNPFNQSTIIEYTLPAMSPVILDVYNVLGQPVRRLVHDVRPPGRHVVAWDGTDENGRQVASGVYFYRLQADEIILTRPMIVVK